MNDEQAERVIRLLEEIRRGQLLQLERQAEALERQAEFLSQQRERLAAASDRAREASSMEVDARRMLEHGAKLAASARILNFVLVPLVVLVLAFFVWLLFNRAAP